MDFAWPSELDTLRVEVLAFIPEATADLDLVDDAWLVQPSPTFNRRMGAKGYIGMKWPRQYGGQEAGTLEHFTVMETLLLGGAPVSGAWFPDRQIGPVLLQYGTDAQKERWIPEIVAGESSWCIGMSEPNAGSDVAAIATKAELHGDQFVVNGQKIWTSGAHEADWCYLICRTDPHSAPHRGMSELVVDMSSPGITVKQIRDASGSDHFCEVFFDDVVVSKDNLIGQLNNSFGQTMRQLEHERGGIDRLVSNKRLYLDMVKVADTSNPLVRQEMAAIETKYTIGRHMVLRNVSRQIDPVYSTVTKTFATEFEQEVAKFCGAVAGPGAMLAGRVARNLVYSPSYTIMGGTTQILRNIIGERILGLPREPRPTQRTT